MASPLDRGTSPPIAPSSRDMQTLDPGMPDISEMSSLLEEGIMHNLPTSCSTQNTTILVISGVLVGLVVLVAVLVAIVQTVKNK